MIDGRTESYLDKLKNSFSDQKSLLKFLCIHRSLNTLIVKLFNKTLIPPKLNIDVLRERFGSKFSEQFTGKPPAISRRLEI